MIYVDSKNIKRLSITKNIKPTRTFIMPVGLVTFTATLFN